MQGELIEYDPGEAPGVRAGNRALTLYQPWGWLMVHHMKRIENRGWKPPAWIIGERIYVHQGKKWDADGAEYIRDQLGGFEVWPPLARAVGVLGSFRIDGCLDKDRGDKPPAGQDRWFFGPYGWLTSEPRALRTVVQWRGALSLWKVPPDLERLIAEAI